MGRGERESKLGSRVLSSRTQAVTSVEFSSLLSKGAQLRVQQPRKLL